MKAYNHALSSVKKFGGKVEDYIKIHEWFDESKGFYGDLRHRALRHHTQGIVECEKLFGVTITNSKNKKVVVKSIAEQHILEDLGFLPTMESWFKNIIPQKWMSSIRHQVPKNLN